MNIKPYSRVEKEDWINRKWRPMMAWVYMVICVFDFIIAPVLNFVFFGKYGGDFISWKPLTMSDGGIFHLAMGAVLGITAWTRGQEKIRAHQRYNFEQQDYEYESTSDYRDRAIRQSSRENG